RTHGREGQDRAGPDLGGGGVGRAGCRAMRFTRPRPVTLLAGSVFCLSLGIFMHLSMNVNFIHEILHGSTWQQGYLEAIRETQGILSFFVIALLAGRSEPKIAAFMM